MMMAQVLKVINAIGNNFVSCPVRSLLALVLTRLVRYGQSLEMLLAVGVTRETYVDAGKSFHVRSRRQSPSLVSLNTRL